jgi:hypothetical protein
MPRLGRSRSCPLMHGEHTASAPGSSPPRSIGCASAFPLLSDEPLHWGIVVGLDGPAPHVHLRLVRRLSSMLLKAAGTSPEIAWRNWVKPLASSHDPAFLVR